MKVLLINGSPHKEGNTYIALKEMMNEFEKAVKWLKPHLELKISIVETFSVTSISFSINTTFAIIYKIIKQKLFLKNKNFYTSFLQHNISNIIIFFPT